MSNRVRAPLAEPEQSKTHFTKSQKVRPIRLTDQIVDIIKDQIFSGVLRPGDRVVEQKFARDLGVGQNAIREALISLAHTGFVRRVPNKGTYVTEITREDGRKIARIRGALEGLVIDLVLERARKEPLDFSVLDDRVAQMRRLLKARDIVTFYERDIEYHRALWQLAGDEYLSQLLEQIVVPLFAFFIMVNRDPQRQFEEIAVATEIHQEIADGLKARSPDAARRAFQKLLDTSLVFSGGPPATDKAPAKPRTRRVAT